MPHAPCDSTAAAPLAILDPGAAWAVYHADPAAFYALLRTLTPAQLADFAVAFAAFAAAQFDCPAMPHDFLAVWLVRIAARQADATLAARSTRCTTLKTPIRPPTWTPIRWRCCRRSSTRRRRSMRGR